MAEIQGSPDGKKIVVRPTETETPPHLGRLFTNLQVSPLIESQSLSASITPSQEIKPPSDQPTHVDPTSDIQIQIDTMHRIREQEHSMHTTRENETSSESMHTLREREKRFEDSVDFVYNTRIALAAIEAWARKGDTSIDEVNAIATLVEDLNKYLTSYADSGELGFSDRIRAAARRYITEDVVDELYGGSEEHKMLVDDSDNAEEIRKMIAPIISHDLRNPITALKGIAQLRERFAATGKDIPHAQEKLDSARINLLNEVVYLHNLVEEGLTMDEFTGKQIGELMKEFLGEDTIVHISEEALQRKIYSCEKWFRRLLPNMRKNTDEQYEMRDERYPSRAFEVDADGKPTRGQMIVTIDTFIDNAQIRRMRMRIGDIATGFPEKRLLEGFKSRGTDKADGTGRAMAFSTATGDKIYRYVIRPQTVVRDARGNVIKLIESNDLVGQSTELIEKEIKDGKVVSEKAIHSDEYMKIGEQPYAGAQTEIVARVIE